MKKRSVFNFKALISVFQIAIIFCLLGAGLIFGMEIIARKMKKS